MSEDQYSVKCLEDSDDPSSSSETSLSEHIEDVFQSNPHDSKNKNGTEQLSRHSSIHISAIEEQVTKVNPATQAYPAPQNSINFYSNNLYQKVLQPPEVHVTLSNNEMWKEFSAHGNEMVITKAGRRMFPIVKIRVSNMDPESFYFVMLDVVPYDNRRYRFVGDRWIIPPDSGHFAIPKLSTHYYMHPESPAQGSKWMEHHISFNRVKLINKLTAQPQMFTLKSMRKYFIRIHIVQESDVKMLPYSRFSTFPLYETAFIAVTAYQNSKVVGLKVDNNPFAKAFRTQTKEKRLSSSSEENSDYTNGYISPRTEEKRIKLDTSTKCYNQFCNCRGRTIAPATHLRPNSPPPSSIPMDVPLTIDTSSPGVPRFSNWNPLYFRSHAIFRQNTKASYPTYPPQTYYLGPTPHSMDNHLLTPLLTPMSYSFQNWLAPSKLAFYFANKNCQNQRAVESVLRNTADNKIRDP